MGYMHSIAYLGVEGKDYEYKTSLENKTKILSPKTKGCGRAEYPLTEFCSACL